MRLEQDRPHRRTAGLLGIVALALAIEVAVSLILISKGRDALVRTAWEGDSGGYVNLAKTLIDGVQRPTYRAVGYPLFLAASLLAGGQQWGLPLAVGIQLLLNVALVVLFCRYLQHLIPDVRTWETTLLSMVLLLGGLGTALWLMSDFQAGLLFAIAMYCLVCRKGRWGTTVGGLAACCLILTRPSFSALPVLLLVCALVLRRSAWRIPVAQLIFYITFSALGLGVNWYRQTKSASDLQNGYLAKFADAVAVKKFRPAGETTDAWFYQEGAAIAGRPWDDLTRRERDDYALRALAQHVRRQPVRFAIGSAVTFVKYTFVPLENAVGSVFSVLSLRYPTWLRVLLAALFLPLWLLMLIPPLRDRRFLPYYFAVVVLFVYEVGVSALDSAQGERIRFPLLFVMLPLVIVNLRSLASLVRVRRSGTDFVHREVKSGEVRDSASREFCGMTTS
jgi:hypothetical protein